MDPTRSPELAARLLLAERDALLPVLRRSPADAFDRPTVCTGWSVRDVLAHCGSALTRVADGTLHDFSPEANEADVAQRRPWPLEAVVAELERGYAAAPVIAADGGRLDGIALGEWVHGGDVREPLGAPRPYESEGVEDALVLLVERSRRRAVPPTRGPAAGPGAAAGRGRGRRHPGRAGHRPPDPDAAVLGPPSRSGPLPAGRRRPEPVPAVQVAAEASGARRRGSPRVARAGRRNRPGDPNPLDGRQGHRCYTSQVPAGFAVPAEAGAA